MCTYQQLKPTLENNVRLYVGVCKGGGGAWRWMLVEVIRTGTGFFHFGGWGEFCGRVFAGECIRTVGIYANGRFSTLFEPGTPVMTP